MNDLGAIVRASSPVILTGAQTSGYEAHLSSAALQCLVFARMRVRGGIHGQALVVYSHDAAHGIYLDIYRKTEYTLIYAI